MRKILLISMALIATAVISYCIGLRQSTSKVTRAIMYDVDTIPAVEESAWLQYYLSTESLLDKICDDTPGYFRDILMEQDVYDRYQLSKEYLDSLRRECIMFNYKYYEL